MFFCNHQGNPYNEADVPIGDDASRGCGTMFALIWPQAPSFLFEAAENPMRKS